MPLQEACRPLTLVPQEAADPEKQVKRPLTVEKQVKRPLTVEKQEELALRGVVRERSL